MGHADSFRRLSRDHRRAADLGSRAPGTFPSHLHTTAVAQLAGEGRVHYRRLYARACAALRRESGWVAIVSVVVNDRGNSVVDFNGSIHRLSFRAGQSARHVAKPAAAAASAGPGVAARLGGLVASGSDSRRRHDVAGVGPGNLELHSSVDDMG